MHLETFNQEYVRKRKQVDFRLGDLVCWTSRSSKGSSTKVGTIVCIIQPGEDVYEAFKHHSHYVVLPMGRPRASKSYLVSVEQPYKKTPNKPKLYFPFTNLLRRQNEINT